MYQQASYETGVKPGAIRMAAVRLGQTKKARPSLNFMFTPVQEEELVMACVVHAPQGNTTIEHGV